MKFETISLY